MIEESTINKKEASTQTLPTGYWVVAEDTGETVFVKVPWHTGQKKIKVKTFDGIEKPLTYRESRASGAPPQKEKKKEGRPQEKRDNSFCVAALGAYVDFESAILDFPFLENIIMGVAKLDYNGQRGLVPNTLYILLSSLPEITSQAVREVSWCSDRHARNYASALRICAEAFEIEYKKFLS